MEAEAESIEAMHEKLTNWEDEDKTVVECVKALHKSMWRHGFWGCLRQS